MVEAMDEFGAACAELRQDVAKQLRLDVVRQWYLDGLDWLVRRLRRA